MPLTCTSCCYMSLPSASTLQFMVNHQHLPAHMKWNNFIGTFLSISNTKHNGEVFSHVCTSTLTAFIKKNEHHVYFKKRYLTASFVWPFSSEELSLSGDFVRDWEANAAVYWGKKKKKPGTDHLQKKVYNVNLSMQKHIGSEVWYTKWVAVFSVCFFVCFF